MYDESALNATRNWVHLSSRFFYLFLIVLFVEDVFLCVVECSHRDGTMAIVGKYLRLLFLFDFVLNCRGTGYHASSQVESLARLARRLLSGNVLIIVDHRARYWSRN